MFLKFNLWKKLLKDAWKSVGLVVGSRGENYYISGGWWVLKILKDGMSNKEKAAMIELIGEFPEEGQSFKALEKEGNQYEVGRMEGLEEIIDRKYPHDYQETRLIYQLGRKYCRVFQEDTSDTCILMNNVISELIDAKSIDPMEETPPEGPYGQRGASILVWENNVMKFCMYGIDIQKGEEGEQESEEAAVLELLGNMMLPAIMG